MKIAILLGILGLTAITVAVLTRETHKAVPSRKDVVGMWNDGRVGENTGLCFAPDGSGELISMCCYDLAWSFDPSTEIVTIKLLTKQAGAEIIRQFKFDADRDQLTGTDKHQSIQEWTFSRRSPEDFERWSALKKKNEAERKE